MTTPADAAGSGEVERATTLELFLDLVFVFTVTQLTSLVSHPTGLAAYGKAALILGVTWWMYDGFVWLTGNLSMARPGYRMGVFAGMAGFLLMALAIPGVFGATAASADNALVFGLAYLGVTALHAGLFATAPNTSAQAIRRIAPFNFAAAALVLLAAFLPVDWRWVGWLGALVVIASTSLFGRIDGWSVSAWHFVERHGLVLIVALGESIVAIGIGAEGRRLTPELIATALLALVLSGTLWWLYFDRDDEAAAEAFAATGGNTRSRLGLWIAYVHVVMVAGVILMAAGVRAIVADPGAPARAAAAWNVAAGVGLYVAGESAFRSILHLGPSWRRAVVVGAVVLTVPVGQWVSGVLQLVLVTAAMVVLILTEGARAGQRSGAGDAAIGRGGG